MISCEWGCFLNLILQLWLRLWMKSCQNGLAPFPSSPRVLLQRQGNKRLSIMLKAMPSARRLESLLDRVFCLLLLRPCSLKWSGCREDKKKNTWGTKTEKERITSFGSTQTLNRAPSRLINPETTTAAMVATWSSWASALCRRRV